MNRYAAPHNRRLRFPGERVRRLNPRPGDVGGKAEPLSGYVGGNLNAKGALGLDDLCGDDARGDLCQHIW